MPLRPTEPERANREESSRETSRVRARCPLTAVCCLSLGLSTTMARTHRWALSAARALSASAKGKSRTFPPRHHPRRPPPHPRRRFLAGIISVSPLFEIILLQTSRPSKILASPLLRPPRVRPLIVVLVTPPPSSLFYSFSVSASIKLIGGTLFRRSRRERRP